jgi:hypothetical protein
MHLLSRCMMQLQPLMVCATGGRLKQMAMQISAVHFSFGTYGGPEIIVKELEPNKVVKCNCVDGIEDWVGTELSFTLDNNEGKTRVRFAHANWKNDRDFFAACSFTWGRYMGKPAAVL